MDIVAKNFNEKGRNITSMKKNCESSVKIALYKSYTLKPFSHGGTSFINITKPLGTQTTVVSKPKFWELIHHKIKM